MQNSAELHRISGGIRKGICAGNYVSNDAYKLCMLTLEISIKGLVSLTKLASTLIFSTLYLHSPSTFTPVVGWKFASVLETSTGWIRWRGIPLPTR